MVSCLEKTTKHAEIRIVAVSREGKKEKSQPLLPQVIPEKVVFLFGESQR